MEDLLAEYSPTNVSYKHLKEIEEDEPINFNEDEEDFIPTPILGRGFTQTYKKKKIKDYVVSDRKLRQLPQGRGFGTGGPVIVEVLVIFDYSLTREFDGNKKRIMDYVAVFFRAVNLRYKRLGDPYIIFRVRKITSYCLRQNMFR